MVNIVPITKPDIDIGNSYRPISLLSVIAKTPENCLILYITANISNTPTNTKKHGYKTQHSTVTVIHTLNNTASKGFHQMALPARTITVTLNISKDFDTINIHTLIIKLLQTKVPGTIIKFMANYIKGRKAYTTYINHTFLQRKFKTGVPQGGVVSPILFNIYTSEIPPPIALVQFMAYADDITITTTHTITSAAKKYIQPCIHKKIPCTKQNNLTENQDKTTCTLFIPDPAEYASNLYLKINNTVLPMATHPKVLGLILDPTLTYRPHIHNISVQAHTPLQMIKVLTATGWDKQKETLMNTYKTVMRRLWHMPLPYGRLLHPRPALKPQVIQNAALRTATGCTHDTNIQHLHNETLILPYTSTYSSTRHNTNGKHNINHTPYNILQHSKAQNPTIFTTADTQQTFPKSLQHTSKQTCPIYIHLLYLGIYAQETITK